MPKPCNTHTNQMGREVLEGLRVSQSQQRPLSRKINKRIIAPYTAIGQKCFFLSLRIELECSVNLRSAVYGQAEVPAAKIRYTFQ